MDAASLGQRVAQARDDAEVTQEGLGEAVGLDRSAISRLEKGERKLNVPELVQIAAALGRPLAYFVSDPVPAIVSRRSDVAHAHSSTRKLDVELEQFSADLHALLTRGLLPATERVARSIPKDHGEAERIAVAVRSSTGLGTGPIADLGRTCEALGLYTFAAPLGPQGPDGGCVEVEAGDAVVGAAVVNGDVPGGRRRMTLAHELGHWLFGDAYDSEASRDSERMINSFAIHFLAPMAGVRKVWSERAEWSERDRALAVAATFRLSWSAAISQLRNLNFIDYELHGTLSRRDPSRGEYLKLGLTWADEFEAPYLSPLFTSSVLSAYVSGQLTAARTLELLHETLALDQLPEREDSTTSYLRRAFAGHDD